MQRLILNYDGSSLLDLSPALNTPLESSAPVELGGSNYLYVGSVLPLTSLYAALSASATGAQLGVEYYTSEGWQAARYTQDLTDGLSTSGYIEFEAFRDKPWFKVGNTVDVVELSSYELYDRYWCRLSLDAVATVTMEWLGHKFCSSTDLLRQFPGLRTSSALRVFGDSKTDWEEETIIASELMIQDLRDKYSIISADQLGQIDRLKHACVARTAALIYSGFGDSGVDDEQRALEKYENRLTPGQIVVDSNSDGIVSPEETVPGSYTLRR